MTADAPARWQADAPSAIPLIIGITGHRDPRPDDLPALRAQIRTIFEDLRANYPETPLLVLSPLAEGADRLVAQVGLECGAQLVAPLPFPADEYEKDCQHPNDAEQTRKCKAEFADLLARASNHFVIPLVAGNTPENIQAYGPNRDHQYTAVGAYVARHSQLLIALWDGTDTGLEGGTAEIVRFKLEGVPVPYGPPHHPLDVVDSGPVYHILTPRQHHPPPQGTPLSLKKLFPAAHEPTVVTDDAYERILARLNTFNRDARRLASSLQEKLAANRAYVIPEEKAGGLSASAQRLLDQYAMADTLALHFQRRRRWTLIALFTVAVLAVVSFEVYAHLLGRPLVLGLYPSLLMAAMAIYLWARRQDYQNKHLDYRALAEGLRVQLFWHLAGLEDEVVEHYLRQHRTELEWIRQAIRACTTPAPRADHPSGSTAMPGRAETLKAFVLTHWVEDQCRFFTSATDRDRNKLERHEGLAQALFVFGILLAVAVVILHSALGESEGYAHWHHWLIVAMGTAPAIAAGMGGYAEKMVFSAQSKRYQWMSALFTRANTRLQALLSQGKLAAARELIYDLGKEALEENGDWVMLHRERPLTPPRG